MYKIQQSDFLNRMIAPFSIIALVVAFPFHVQSAGTGYQPTPQHDPYPPGSPQPLPKCTGSVVSQTIVATSNCNHLVSGACGLHTFCCASCP
ncbi:uncharacterized protein FA14DRAFT_37962 [Meira miltonrushii]|uniref:Uncharacterized protein n=1 Tax=Meira miltonrushii TaxID=1280837 RepID=A0A316VCU0_9BASI|nr:uncharacterized protein FA14DRAFT_37962 [Meira miltonrushii]PWN35124.1 hypothetical protein FA14DRAFT_37962 [Meira miltonrushii]